MLMDIVLMYFPEHNSAFTNGGWKSGVKSEVSDG